MKQRRTQGLACLMALVLALSLFLPAFAAGSEDQLRQAVDTSAQYLLAETERPQVGSIGGEWAVLGLARSGYAVPQSYWDTYYADVEAYVAACQGVLHEKKYTEYSRLVVALTAIGADPRDVAGYDLLSPLGDFEKTVWQGVNGPIWALIALDCGGYPLPAGATATRQMYVEEILRCQLDCGGWSLTAEGGSSTADADITGMALQALSNYRDQAQVKAAVDSALPCLSQMQDNDGGFGSWGSANSESCAQVLVALGELGIDLEDSRFVKNGHTVLDGLLCFRQEDGSFRHTMAGSGNDRMASEQGLYALVSALRAAEGRSSLYQMDDVTISVSNGTENGAEGLPNKHEDVQTVPVTAPGTTFSDIDRHPNQPAIEAMAARGIINGKGDGRFDPNANMTRAEFAAITVRTLGLTPKAQDAFTDVAPDQWFAPYVGTAYAYGIINGVGGGRFDPDGTITRQEAAVMVARAAKLCGMDTALDAAAIRDTLAQFGDYMTSAAWALEGLAFCYRENLLDQSDLEIRPTTPILRCEIAQMLYLLLDGANLL